MTDQPTVLAAGGVVWRPGPDGEPEILLVHRPRYDDWSLPKGKLDPGEHPARAAVREVNEETGLVLALGRALPTVEYRVPTATGEADKIVRYWAMQAGLDDVAAGNGPHEVDEIAWLPLREASLKLSRHADRAPLRALARGPLRTSTVQLVRHGSAGSRARWPGSDDDRPLDERGRAQAGRLAEVLPSWGPHFLVSAPALRCRQTIEGLALASGLAVTVSAAFSEEGFAADPDTGQTLLTALAQKFRCTVIASQGGAIPALVRRLTEQHGLARTEVGSRKGSVWTLTFAGPRLVAADYDTSMR